MVEAVEYMLDRARWLAGDLTLGLRVCDNSSVARGAWDEARFVLPGGQSGNPFSPHYDDLLALWRRGEGVPIAWSREAVERAALKTLRLLPL